MKNSLWKVIGTKYSPAPGRFLRGRTTEEQEVRGVDDSLNMSDHTLAFPPSFYMFQRSQPLSKSLPDGGKAASCLAVLAVGDQLRGR